MVTLQANQQKQLQNLVICWLVICIECRVQEFESPWPHLIFPVIIKNFRGSVVIMWLLWVYKYWVLILSLTKPLIGWFKYSSSLSIEAFLKERENEGLKDLLR